MHDGKANCVCVAFALCLRDILKVLERFISLYSGFGARLGNEMTALQLARVTVAHQGSEQLQQPHSVHEYDA